MRPGSAPAELRCSEALSAAHRTGLHVPPLVAGAEAGASRSCGLAKATTRPCWAGLTKVQWVRARPARTRAQPRAWRAGRGRPASPGCGSGIAAPGGSRLATSTFGGGAPARPSARAVARTSATGRRRRGGTLSGGQRAPCAQSAPGWWSGGTRHVGHAATPRARWRPVAPMPAAGRRGRRGGRAGAEAGHAAGACRGVSGTLRRGNGRVAVARRVGRRGAAQRPARRRPAKAAAGGPVAAAQAVWRWAASSFSCAASHSASARASPSITSAYLRFQVSNSPMRSCS